MSQKMMMKCRICGKSYHIDDPIRRTCGNHSDAKYNERKEDGILFLRIIRRNFQDPFYQNHSHAIFKDDQYERFYSQLWFGY